jgi:dihydrofolate synthase/folylpolyglutamate synthase
MFYDKIDSHRIKVAYDVLDNAINVNLGIVIHIVGTNGKGSTGNFIAKYLNSLSLKVGHYTSPHIFDFNERIICNDKKITNNELDGIHKILFSILGDNLSNSLSYFEYTTLMMVLFFHNQKLNYSIIEAGLGGELDATNVINKNISLITPISLDHEAFLGKNINDIARTKLNSISNIAILGIQNNEVLKVAKDIKNSKNVKIINYFDILSSDDILQISALDIPNFQKENISLAISALKYFNFFYINYQTLSKFILKYRLLKLKENIFIDVGHNVASASSILQEFIEKNKKIILIYNSYKDKNYIQIIEILKPIIKEVQIISINNDRIENIDILKINIENLGINVDNYNGHFKGEDIYLVYGSFLVVEKFIKLNKDCFEK